MHGSDFRTDINGLRGLGVALVVAYHFHWRGAGGGFIGVDIFFVISGYLMTRIIWRDLVVGQLNYWRFVSARAARIWPALAAVLLVLFVTGVFWLPPLDLQVLAEQAKWAMVFGSNHYYNNHSGYNTQSADNLWLLHTWSLSVEWQFYMLYPLLLMAVALCWRRLRPVHETNEIRRALLGVLLLVTLSSFIYQVRLAEADPQGSFFLLPSRVWELSIGGVIYLTEREQRGLSEWWRAAICYVGLTLLMFSALVIGYLHIQPAGLGGYLVVPVSGVVLVLWANDRRNLFLRQRWVQTLGLWSYSVYLWHWPIWVALRLTTYPVEHPRLSMLTATVASLAVGWFSFRYVERLGAARNASSAARVAIKPTLALLLAGLATLAVISSAGLAIWGRDRDSFYRHYEASVRPLIFPDECSNFKKDAQNLKVCQIEKKGTRRRILVIGDSHAQHLYPWFAVHSKVSVDFFTASECPPVPHMERMQAGYHCLEYAALAWQRAESPQYDAVIVSARWATVGLNGPPYCHRVAERGCVFPELFEKRAIIFAELGAAVRTLLRAGKTVVVLDSAPESQFRVPERLARETFWYGEPRLNIDRQSLREQTAWIDPLFNELSRQQGFHRVSLRDKLCRGEACRVFDSAMQRPIYFDDSHFDPIWIAHNADIFYPFVQEGGDSPQ